MAKVKSTALSKSDRELFAVLVTAHGTQTTDEIVATINKARKAQDREPAKPQSIKSQISALKGKLKRAKMLVDDDYAVRLKGKVIPLAPSDAGQGRGRRADSMEVSDFLDSLVSDENADDSLGFDLDEIVSEIEETESEESETVES